MNKVTVDLRVGEHDTMRVDAYRSSTEGLALHRQVAYVPAKEEHKFTSKWQITHIGTGKALLKPSECVETLSRAKAVARRLSNHDWTLDEPPESASHQDLLKALEAEPESSEDASVPKRRYVVRRNPDGPGYVVVDSNTEATVEEHMHRGLASERAKELDGQVST